jgi:hypothetical protein
MTGPRQYFLTRMKAWARETALVFSVAAMCAAVAFAVS